MKTRRAYHAPLRLEALRGVCLALGTAAVVFMGVVCVRRGPGARQTLLLLDAWLALCLAAALVASFRLKRLFGKNLTALRAAVERREDGSARIVYACAERRFALKFPRGSSLPQSGMVDIRIDPKRPRAVFPGGERQSEPLLRRTAPALLLLAAALNAVYFLL